MRYDTLAASVKPGVSLKVHSAALRRAADLLGGKRELRELLRVPMSKLEAWLAGTVAPPLDAFLKAVDVISSSLRAAPGETSTVTLPPGPAKLAVEWALDAALRATGAEMGNVQLLYPDGLRIVAQRGFARPFLDFFARVDDEGSACGAAMKQGRRIVVADVASDAIFAGTAAGEVLAAARVRAVQSTPLVGSGQVIGMLSTHYAAPHELSAHDENVLDHIASRTTLLLESRPL